MDQTAAFQISVLASGSSGNSLYIESEKKKILVDAGLSGKKITSLLQEIGKTPEELDAIFVTHEHRDHISGLPTLTKKYKTPLYSRSDTFQAMFCKNDIPKECFKPIYNSLDLGKVKIETFDISHDAADPIGFSIFANDIYHFSLDIV